MKKRRLKKSNIEVIRDYWEKHEDILVERLKSHNPSFVEKGISNEKLYTLFRDDIMQRVEEKKMDVKDSLKKELHTRAFVSQSEYYKETLKRELSASGEWKKIRDFFRDDKGRFENKTSPEYKGSVSIRGQIHQKYAYTKPNGKSIFVYTANSPGSDVYILFVSETNYE